MISSLYITGSVAQLAERALRMREAPGSKPGVSILFITFNESKYFLFFNQAGEKKELCSAKIHPPDVGVEPTTTRLRALRSAN